MILTEDQVAPNLGATPADMIGCHDDLLTELLIQLPVTSLLRFRCVSKQWLALISSSNFVSRFNEVSRPSTIALYPSKRCLENSPRYYFLSLDGQHACCPLRPLTFADDPAGIQILQSCNGLLCCCSYKTEETKRQYYVYNPTTRQYTTLPKPSDESPGPVLNVTLAFDPSRSLHYKIIRVRSSDSPASYQIDIYCSETGIWRLSGKPFSVPFNLKHGVFCCGAIHWTSKWGSFLCFDVKQEKFREMPRLEIPEDWRLQGMNCKYFGESQGVLHIIMTGETSRSNQFSVCEMERDYSSWCMKYRVDLSTLILAYPEIVSHFHPLHLEQCAFTVLSIVREFEEKSFMVMHIPGKVISYSFYDKTFKVLLDIAPGCTHIHGCLTFGHRDAYTYKESFFCV